MECGKCRRVYVICEYVTTERHIWTIFRHPTTFLFSKKLSGKQKLLFSFLQLLYFLDIWSFLTLLHIGITRDLDRVNLTSVFQLFLDHCNKFWLNSEKFNQLSACHFTYDSLKFNIAIYYNKCFSIIVSRAQISDFILFI